MLSIHTLASSRQAAHYYEKDDYYAGDKNQSPSSWWGAGAKSLGLSGPVDRATFERLLDGELPDGTTLPRRPDQKRRPGFDLTFSAPKSVSLAAFVQNDVRVIEAHQAAVRTSLGYLEERVSFARVQDEDGMIRPVSTKNLVVAEFLHDTSRDLDPQLHTHAVVLNATKTPNGAWRALTNEELLRSKMVGGAIYRAELAMNLRDLGYAVERTHADGRFEVKSYTEAQLSEFSQRRAEIEAALAARGLESAKAAEIAALDTRKKKQDVDRGVLREVWRSRAKEIGIDFEKNLPAPRARDRAVEPHDSERVVKIAVEHLSERRSVFFEREAIAKAAAFGLAKVRLDDIEKGIQRSREERQLLDAKGSDRSLGTRFTTREALVRERALIATMKLGQGELEPILDPHEIGRQMSRTDLTRGQREAVELVLSSRDRVVGIQGYAGTGKTTALSEVRKLAERSGFRVRGFATTAAAVEVLRETGLESTTLADHLTRERGRRAGRDLAGADPELWILDEASLLGTKDALAFLREAERSNARVVFVGDRAQLPAIEAGKPFALMVDRGLETATMDEVQRQRDPTLKRVVEATINRDLDRALSMLRPSIQEITNRADRLQAVANAYLDLDPPARANAIVLTASNADRREINGRIRAGLEQTGELHGPAVGTTVLAKADFTKVEQREAASYKKGDVVRFGRAYKTLGVGKGEYAQVINVDPESNVLVLERRDGTMAQFSPERTSLVEVYAAEERALCVGDHIRFTRNDRKRGRINGSEAIVVAIDHANSSATIDRNGRRELLDLKMERHWEHGYARTVYGAQGRTTDKAILHIDTEDRNLIGYESFYVSVSRARSSVDIYTNDASELPAAIQRELAKDAAIELAIVAMPGKRRADRLEYMLATKKD
jgi:conjugative relaxase-like TrwC/TraI family protein